MEWVSPLICGIALIWLAYRIGRGFDFGLHPWIIPGFLLFKLFLGGVVFFLFTNYYPNRSEADIFKFFDDAKVLFNYMRLEPSSITDIMFHSNVPREVAPRLKSWFAGGGYNLFDSSRLMVKVHIVFRIFSFGSYHVHAFLFAFVSFLGCVALLKAIRQHTQLSMVAVICCMLMPSFQLWSSAPLKESVSVFFLLLSIARFFNHFHAPNHKDVFWGIAYLIPLFFFKPFYSLLMLPCILISLWNIHLESKKYLLAIIAGFSLLWIADLTLGSQSPIEIMARKQLDFYDHSGKWAGSMTSTPLLVPNMSGLLRLIPYALLNSFIKPLPWDSLNPLYLASSFENILLITMLVYTIFRFPKTDSMANKRFILFSLSFLLLIYLLLGFSCPIIGSLMRFKSPVMVLVPLATLMCSGYFRIEKLQGQLPKPTHNP